MYKLFNNEPNVSKDQMIHASICQLVDDAIAGDYAGYFRSFLEGMYYDNLFSWDNQAKQYPQKDKEGYNYFKGILSDKNEVNCLLRYNEKEELIAILNHYPFERPDLEIKKGDFVVFVRPDMRRKGVAKELIKEGKKRFGISNKTIRNYYEISTPRIVENLS